MMTNQPAPDTALVPVSIDDQLTSQEALDRLVAAIRAAVTPIALDDVVLVQDASEYVVETADDYQRGFLLLEELADLTDRITADHERFKKPLAVLTGVVRESEKAMADPVAAARKSLGAKLGQWKVTADRIAAEEAAARQRAADLAAQAAAAQKAATLDALAKAEPNPALAAVLAMEAAEVAATPIKAAPVEAAPVAKPVGGGHTRSNWSARIVDLKALFRAWLDGRCALPEEPLAEAIQPYLNTQARNLHGALKVAYPGTEAVSSATGVARRTARPTRSGV